jgi:hypothetical protein
MTSMLPARRRPLSPPEISANVGLDHQVAAVRKPAENERAAFRLRTPQVQSARLGYKPLGMHPVALGGSFNRRRRLNQAIDVLFAKDSHDTGAPR